MIFRHFSIPNNLKLGFVIHGLLVFGFADLYSQSKQDAPNIILVICDQMRADALGAAGDGPAFTPNLDRLAADGVLVLNNYANNPVCLPSRISLFSGLHPSQTGVLCNKHPGAWLDFKFSLPWYLKQAGYRIGYIGKNHTFTESALANFDVLSLRGREPFRAYSKYVPPYWHSDILWPEEDCHPAKNTSEAIAFIEQSNRSEPFFLTVSYFDPHPPYMAPAAFTSKYCAEEMTLPEYVDPVHLGDRLEEHQRALHYDRIGESELKETKRYYHASVEWGVDYQMGRIVEAIEKQGIADNTVLVFISDHGDFMGEFHMVRKGMFLYDALLHVPMIWYAPGRINNGLQLDQPAQNLDIFPTLLDFAGIEIPHTLQGTSLKNALQGEKSQADRMIFASAAYSDLPDGYWEDPEPYYKPDSKVPFHTRVENLTWKPQFRTAMARTSDWKLILSESRKPELYFMNGGNVERQNLYGQKQYQEISDWLEKEIKSHWNW